MKAARSKMYVSRYVEEDEIFWKNHLSKFNLSGLTRKVYCDQNLVDYYRFTYWMKKLTIEQPKSILEKSESEVSKQLLPVQLKPEVEVSEVAGLFSLVLKNGYILRIHNEQGLSILLDKLQ